MYVVPAGSYISRDRIETLPMATILLLLFWLPLFWLPLLWLTIILATVILATIILATIISKNNNQPGRLVEIDYEGYYLEKDVDNIVKINSC